MIEKLNQIDDILMQFEDWMHDEDGKNCTKARKILAEILAEVKVQCSSLSISEQTNTVVGMKNKINKNTAE